MKRLLILLFTLLPQFALAAERVKSCEGYAGVANKIAGCTLASLDYATSVFFTEFYPYVAGAIGAALLLAVILYGAMVALGTVEQIGRDTVMFVIKIAFVSYLCANADMMYYTITDMMNAGAYDVLEAVPASGNADGTRDFAQIQCLNNMLSVSADAGKPVIGPWLGIDCMLDTVIGIKVPNADGTVDTASTNQQISVSRQGLSRGMLYFMISGMQTSMAGVFMGILGLFFTWSIIMLTIKSLFTFLSGYLAVAFLCILAPLFLPCVLFGPSVREYFDKWSKLLISSAVQPVMMVAFVSLFISAADLAMFSSDYSIAYRIAGEASRQPGFDLNQYITSSGAAISKGLTIAEVKANTATIPTQIENSLSSTVKTSKVQCGNAAKMANVAEDPSCLLNQKIRTFHAALNWDALAAARTPPVVMEGGATTPGQEIANEVLSSFAFCAVMLFVLNSFASMVPKLIGNAVGSSNIGNNLTLGQIAPKMQRRQ